MLTVLCHCVSDEVLGRIVLTEGQIDSATTSRATLTVHLFFCCLFPYLLFIGLKVPDNFVNSQKSTVYVNDDSF